MELVDTIAVVCPVGAQPAATSAARTEREGVKSAVRVLAIITLLADEPNGASFGEICGRLELPKSSTHALLRTMTDQGFLTVEPSTRRYRIGIRLWEAGQTYIRDLDLSLIARPFLDASRDALRETVQLAVLDGVHNVYIGKVDADQRLVVQSRVGSRLPAYATGLGKALLAGLQDEEIRGRFAGVPLEPFTDKTVTEIETLLDILHKIRERGFATDDGEYTPGIVCVAVPIRGYNGEVVAAMSVSVPEARATRESRQHALEVLREQAYGLSRVLGYSEGIAK